PRPRLTGGGPAGAELSIRFEPWKIVPRPANMRGYHKGIIAEAVRAMMDEADGRLAVIRDKVEAGERLSFDDGVLLFDRADLFTLGELANVVRERKNGNNAYYNVNTHLNPTNVCVYRCTFCAFRADLKSPKGYVMTDGQILER